jgi:hypothetical protein
LRLREQQHQALLHAMRDKLVKWGILHAPGC